MIDFTKYPRTYHLQGSKETKDVNDVCGIAFDQGSVIIRHRNQIRGEQWDLLKSWISENEEIFYDRLEERFIMYGEWLFATHTISYDRLTQYFLEYDVFDSQTQTFLYTTRRRQMFAETQIDSKVSRHKYITKEFLNQILDSGAHLSSRALTKNLVENHAR